MKVNPFSVGARGVGLPDYSAPAPIGQVPRPTTYTLTDVGEAAARLGSIVTFDRRGDVIWFDDFEDNLNKWNRVTLGVGAAIALSIDQVRSGSASAKLTTGNVAGNETNMSRQLAYPRLSRVGFELSFTNNFLPSAQYYYWLISVSDGITAPAFSARYVVASRELQIFSGGVWVTLGTIALYPFNTLFHTIKIVCDPANLKYTRILLDNNEYNIAEYSVGVGAPLFGYPYLVVNFRIVSAGANAIIYLDDAIVTQNEPINIPI